MSKDTIKRPPSQIALFARSDGLFEPRTDEGLEFAKNNPGSMFICRSKASNRTDLQNRYLWGWVYEREIVRKLKDAGIMGPANIPWEKDTIHILFREKLLIEGKIEIDQKLVNIYESTAHMSRKRFLEYVADVKELVYSCWGIIVDEPTDQQRDSFFVDVLREIRK